MKHTRRPPMQHPAWRDRPWSPTWPFRGTPALAPAHTTTITQSPTMHTYWWTCTCGDEGGPYDHYEAAWEATAAHEREEDA